MFSENGKTRNSIPPFLDKGEMRKAFFRKELLSHKKDFSNSCLQFLLRMAEVRKLHAEIPLSKDFTSFLESNLPHCFLHLENGKRDAVESSSKRIAPHIIEILSHKEGIERLRWAMERALLLAEPGSNEGIRSTLPTFFSACANICKKGREMDWGMFVSAYTHLREEKTALFAVEISTAKDYPELYEKLSKHHSKLTREKMGAAYSY